MLYGNKKNQQKKKQENLYDINYFHPGPDGIIYKRQTTENQML